MDRKFARTGLLMASLLLVAITGCQTDEPSSPFVSSGQSGVDDAGDTATDGGGETSTGPGSRFPYTLSPLGKPKADSAHVSLYFSVTDNQAEPVEGLQAADFVALEDGAPLDPYESAFRVKIPTGSSVRIPTVLLLDLSRSVVEAGALETVKQAASIIIDNLSDEQELALLTFADDVTVRSEFTTDKDTLRAAVDSISDADGQSTNLYGALVQSFGMWTDGFFASGGAEQLVAGMVVVISDGNDTAGVHTLDQALDARGSKRTFFVRVGQGIDASIADQIATVGVLEATFSDLEATIGAAIQRVQSLNRSIYIAEYCSPKRAGDHELLFTVAGNESFVKETCKPSGTGPSCDGSAMIFCRYEGGGYYSCCPAASPYYCAATNSCYGTQSEAIVACGADSCLSCGVSDDPANRPGPAINLPFSAYDFSSDQCSAFFTDAPGNSEDAPDAR